MKTFKELKVWEKAHKFTLNLYSITKTFPEEEKFGLISQIRRAASSIPLNIVEGNKRESNKDFCHFLNISESSLEEVKYQLLLSKDLKYIPEEEFEQLTQLC